MKQFVYDSWNSVMDADKNPLRHIPDTNTRHMILQVLAWMWCIMFSLYFGSMWVFGMTAIAHMFIISAIVVTVATFSAANKLNWTYHTPSRARAMYYNGKRIELDKNDPGGEHE